MGRRTRFGSLAIGMLLTVVVPPTRAANPVPAPPPTAPAAPPEPVEIWMPEGPTPRARPAGPLSPDLLRPGEAGAVSPGGGPAAQRRPAGPPISPAAPPLPSGRRGQAIPVLPLGEAGRPPGPAAGPPARLLRGLADRGQRPERPPLSGAMAPPQAAPPRGAPPQVQGAMVPPGGPPAVPGGAAPGPAAVTARRVQGASPWMSLLAVLALGGVVSLGLGARRRGRAAAPPPEA